MVIASLVMPACVNLDKIGCCIFVVAFMAGSVLLARKYAPDIFV